jgi:hypothetical protein
MNPVESKVISKVKFDFIQRFFNKKNQKAPKEKEVYAVQTGAYVGEMLVFCKKDGDSYLFLSIPKNINRAIPIDKFNIGFNNQIVELAHVLPSKIYKLCYKQFEFNRKTIK